MATSTIQFDFNLTDRFDMTFVDKDGVEKRPYMIHRALLGSIERFFGVLVEHYAGAFPAWLSPEQVRVIPINESCFDYCKEVGDKLKAEGFRTSTDLSSHHFRAKIKEAQQEKIPYMIVVGNREVESGEMSVRLRTGKQQNWGQYEEFVEKLHKIIDTKQIEL